ncbi:MAG: TonB-dependent receptor [Gammaproteobacteria bacterium]|nr:TonB-dependent receptor [Gammaproteobacteria bacterium]
MKLARSTGTSAALLLLAVFAGETPAQAQLVIEEITVTAQKREESVQDVPISISAFGEDFVATSGMTNVTDVVKFVPGMGFQTDGPTQSVLSIRGIGTSAFSASADSSVGVFLDDVYSGHALTSAQSFFDVERIEVIKGPQGTLFGRNTSAGAISVISKKADRDDSYADFLLGAGSKGQGIYQAIGNYSPNADWGLRLGVKYEERDGTHKNTTDGTELNNKEDLMVRLGIQNDWSDRFRSQVLIQYGSSGAYYGVVPIDPDDRKGGVETETVEQNTRNDQDVSSFRGALRLEYDLSDSILLTSITSYFDSEAIGIPFDADTFTVRVLEFEEPAEFEYLSQEFRLNGSSDNVDWFVGASVRTEDVSVNTQLRYSDFDAIDLLLGEPCTNFEPDFGTCNSAVVEPSLAIAANDSWGVYGDVTWHATDRLGITVGARFSNDEKDIKQNTPWQGANSVTAALLDDNLLELVTAGVLTASDDWNDFSPRLAITYDANDDLMIYANASKGYKAGGFNSGPDRSVSSLGPGDSQSVLGFGPEESLAYEIGFKSTLADQRLRLNGALFFIDYENLQVETFKGLAFAIDNVSDAESKGFELEGQWLATENLEVLFSYSYLDAELKNGSIADPDLPGGFVDISGMKLFNAPENSFTATALYSQPMDWGSLDVRLGVSHIDDQLIADYLLVGDSFFFIESHDIWDVRVAATDDDQRWSVALIGENIGDERWFNQLRDPAGITQGVPNIGDLWRVEFTYSTN